MIIIVDTREQRPMFTLNIQKQGLIVGDYTTTKLLRIFHIERKSLPDLYATLTTQNNRFKSELFRAAYHQIIMPVYVEGSYQDFINKKFDGGYGREVSTQTLERLVDTFQVKYYLEFHWHPGRDAARRAIKSRLELEENARFPKRAKSGQKAIK